MTREANVDYRVLGRVSVHREGESLEVGAFKQASLLACLLMNANNVVPTDQLLEALWGEDASTSRQNTLWVYVSNLRSVLDPERPARSDGTVLLTRAPGYVLQVDDEGLDALRFERLVAEGRSLAESDPAAGSLVLAEALAMWTGKPYEDFTYEPFAQTEIRRLEELRLEAVESRVDADLRRGLARELVSELETLTRQHPTHESFTAQLMLALYRSGRQAQALRAYNILRSTLGEELGIEPSARLVALEESIVVGDEALDMPAASGGSPARTGLAVRGYELRDQIGEGAFGVVYRAYQPAVGREVAIKIIRPELANSPTFIRRFEAEAQLVASLEHPHIVPLYDYWREPHAAYLVMRYMRGGSLGAVIRESALDLDSAVKVTGQLAEALTAAHASGVIHRDVKPSNVLLDDDGNAYLSDFGIAVSGVPGQAVDEVLDRATLAAPYASPEQEQRTPLTAASDIYSLAVVLAQTISGAVGTVEDISGFLPSPARAVIERATQRQAINRYATVAEFAAALNASAGTSETATVAEHTLPTRNPYKGLLAFGRTDAGDFFGREELIDRLLDRLAGAGVRSRFVALVGPSGSGKSSVVRAGLIPALLAGRIPLSETWFTVEMTPGVDPYAELADGLSTIATEHVTTTVPIAEMVRASLPDDGSQLVLVIDQFEELFTHSADETRERFLAELADLIRRDNGRTKVVATMRADFYDRPLANREFGDLLRHGTEVITPMRPEELERAIRGPATAAGISFDTALVSRLIGDIGDRSGALPLLQYALTELVEAVPSGDIGLDAYEQIGGLTGALARRADALWEELPESAQVGAEQVFLSLVTLGEGVEDTRRRVLLHELRGLSIDLNDLDTVVNSYATHRLLSLDRDPVTRGPTVEISHEALLSQWGRLRTLVDEARDDVRRQRALSRSASEWDAEGRPRELLLAAGRLARYEEWLPLSRVRVGGLEHDLLEASRAQRDAEREREEEQRRREDALERQAARRLRTITLVSLTATVLAVIAGAFILRQSGDLQDERDAATNAAIVLEGQTQQLETQAGELERLADEERLQRQLVEASLARLQAVDMPARAMNLHDEDPGLALFLAGEAVARAHETGASIEIAVAALHSVLQDLNARFPDGAAFHAVVNTPRGIRAVFDLPLLEVLEMRDRELEELWTTRPDTDRDALCNEYLGTACPTESVTSRVPASLTSDVGIAPTFLSRPLERTQLRLLWTSEDIFDNDRGVIFETESRLFELTFGVDVRTEELRDATTSDGEFIEPQHVATSPWLLHGQLAPSLALDGIISETELAANAPPTMNEHLVADGERFAVWTSYDALSVVWHRRDVFDSVGITPPTTWSGLLAVSDAIVAAGYTPWCLGLQGDLAIVPLLSMVQSQIIDIGGIDLFDRWVAHAIPADHPEIVEAHERVASLMFTDRFIGGADVVERRGARLQGVLLANEPDCVMWVAPRSWLATAQRKLPDPSDVGVFALPTRSFDAAPAAIVNGSILSLVSDRPESRTLIRSILSAEFGKTTAALDIDPEFVANLRLSPLEYSDDNARVVAADLRDAGRADRMRLELFAQIPELYRIYTSVLADWFEGGAEATSAVLAEVETEWSRLDGS